MVDIHVYPFFEQISALKWLHDIDILGECEVEHLQEWQRRMEGQLCVQQAAVPGEWHREYINGWLKEDNPQYDIGLTDV